MTPVNQTIRGSTQGNCFAACVASILDMKLEEVEIDMTNVRNFNTLLTTIQKKANCKIYYVNHEAIIDGFLKTSERYCFVEVCTFVFNGDPYDEGSLWHVVVCEIAENGKISLVFNPDTVDQRQKSLDQFPAVRKVLFVKPNKPNLR
jgi:hypothetical protein